MFNQTGASLIFVSINAPESTLMFALRLKPPWGTEHDLKQMYSKQKLANSFY